MTTSTLASRNGTHTNGTHATADFEVPAQARRRKLPASYKVRILCEADGCSQAAGAWKSGYHSWKRASTDDAVDGGLGERRGDGLAVTPRPDIRPSRDVAWYPKTGATFVDTLAAVRWQLCCPLAALGQPQSAIPDARPRRGHLSARCPSVPWSRLHGMPPESARVASKAWESYWLVRRSTSGARMYSGVSRRRALVTRTLSRARMSIA